jgi:hypothetical protein
MEWGIMQQQPTPAVLRFCCFKQLIKLVFFLWTTVENAHHHYPVVAHQHNVQREGHFLVFEVCVARRKKE